MLQLSAQMMLQVNPPEDCGKVPLAAVLKEKVYVSTTYISWAQNFCVSSINAVMSASLFYTPQNVYSLIRPKTGNGLLRAQPGCNGFLRRHSHPAWGTIEYVSKKPNPHDLPFTGNYSQKGKTLPLNPVEYLWWVGIICPHTPRHLCSAITNFSPALWILPSAGGSCFQAQFKCEKGFFGENQQINPQTSPSAHCHAGTGWSFQGKASSREGRVDSWTADGLRTHTELSPSAGKCPLNVLASYSDGKTHAQYSASQSLAAPYDHFRKQLKCILGKLGEEIFVGGWGGQQTYRLLSIQPPRGELNPVSFRKY